jgi:hypothetical protein
MENCDAQKWLGIASRYGHTDISGAELPVSDTWLLIKSSAYDCFSDGLINGMTDRQMTGCQRQAYAQSAKFGTLVA